MGYTHYFRYQPTSASFATVWAQIITDSRVICQAATAAGIALAGPLGTGTPVIDEAHGIGLNGDAERGEDYETFTILPPQVPGSDHQSWFCKTERRPYDLAVTAILLRCKLLAPHEFRIASDGTWQEWATPIGRGLPSTRQFITDLFGPVRDLTGWDDI